MTTITTSDLILTAARECLLADGYAAMSTRKVAQQADVPLSQIHYHFGSKDQLILALLAAENERLLDRQAELFDPSIPLWKRWDLACDVFDDDIESGYVRVLQEMIAAGWSSEQVRGDVREMLDGWNAVLTDLFSDTGVAAIDAAIAQHLAALTSALFLGAESLILLGMEDGERWPIRPALRAVGAHLRWLEETA